jgi:hypothetical protein
MMPEMPRLTLAGSFHQFRRFVVALSGVHVQTLDQVPSERARFESLGWAILITSGMAVVSMWFALSSAMGVNGILAVPPALLWGLVIMGIDRWLVTSMPTESSRKFLMAVPRLLLALLLGTLISTPFVLRIFEPEINAQIAVMQQNGYNNFLKQQQSGDVAKQVSTYKSELQQLNTVITSHGASTGNTASDPQLVSYNNQLTQLQSQQVKWIGLKNTYYNNFTCQKYGGAQCPKKGVGPAADASYKSYQQAAQEVTTIQGEIDQVRANIATRDKQLNSNSAADQQARYQQAVSQQPQVLAEYNTAVQRQNQLQAVYYTQEQANHGLLIRLEALSQLSNGNSTVTSARWLLFLLFLTIECLPVTVKLLQRPGLYEEALLYTRNAEHAHAKRFYRNWSGPDKSVPAESVAPVVITGRAERGDSVLDLWTPTRALPRSLGDPEDERGTEIVGYQSGYGGTPGYAGQASRADTVQPAPYEAPGGYEAPGQPGQYSQFPPSEAAPLPPHGWGKSAGTGRKPAGRQPAAGGERPAAGEQSAVSWDDPTAGWPAAPEPEQPRWASSAGDAWTAQTRQDVSQPSPPTRSDVYQPEYERAEYGSPEAARGAAPQSEHDALAGMEDEHAAARSDGNGIELSWDDGE